MAAKSDSGGPLHLDRVNGVYPEAVACIEGCGGRRMACHISTVRLLDGVAQPLDVDGSLVPDVTISTWQRPWNLRGDRSVGGAPPSALWATDPAGFGQVGCIYRAQGFEYEETREFLRTMVGTSTDPAATHR